MCGHDQRSYQKDATLLVAVASKDGGTVDQHFGQIDELHVYEMDPGGARLVERRNVDDYVDESDNRREATIRALKGCMALFVAKIGDTPREQLRAANVVAVDGYAGQPVETSITAFFRDYAVLGKRGAQLTLSGAMGDRGSGPEPDPGTFRLLHTMLRVGDLERSVDFYTRLLGMTVLERREHRKNRFSQAYLGYGDPGRHMAVELVFNWERKESYRLGDAFGHIAIQVTGIDKLCERLAADGVTMPRPPRPQRHNKNTVAFIEDPDGYRIELVQMADADAVTS